MFLFQQSAAFRIWTSRALMVYFRRALLFLVVSPRQNRKRQEQICFSDAEDDEEILMISDKRERAESSLDRIPSSPSKHQLSSEYVCTDVSQGVNNSRSKSREKPSMVFDSGHNLYQESKTFPIETINNSEIDGNKLLKDSVDLYQIRTSPHSRINPMLLSSPSCPPCRGLFITSRLLNKRTPPRKPSISKLSTQCSSTSIEENLSSSSEDEDDIYEKYQNSFSHILHPTKSRQTIHQKDRLHSMFELEPNTSIITVRPFNRNTINYSMFTSHISVRLIAHPIDSSILCDAKPIGCKKNTGRTTFHFQQKITKHFDFN